MKAHSTCQLLIVIPLLTLWATALGAADREARPIPVAMTVHDELPEPAGQSVDHSVQSPGVCSALHRAGHPECLHPWAIPSNSCRYGGYYVGGGLPWWGEGRCAFHEGTWGWDYFGILFPKKIALNWGHGARSQRGAGAYKTDGPKLRHE